MTETRNLNAEDFLEDLGYIGQDSLKIFGIYAALDNPIPGILLFSAGLILDLQPTKVRDIKYRSFPIVESYHDFLEGLGMKLFHGCDKLHQRISTYLK